MRAEYVDMKHETTTDPDREGQCDVWVKVRDIGRPDAAALADSIERHVEGFVSAVIARQR